MKKLLLVFLCAVSCALASCAVVTRLPHLPQKPAPEQTEAIAAEEKMVESQRQDLDRWIDIYKTSIDDPSTKEKLRESYNAFQDTCRGLAYRTGGFATGKEKDLCDITQYPFDIFYNDLYIETNGLKHQLFDITTPGTAANDYYVRPSAANLEKLKKLFDQVHKYYVGTPYTWYRYYNKYLFSKSRLEHFNREWEDRYREYVEAQKIPHNPDLGFARKRAEFAYKRFKEDCRWNNLPYSCQVNAFYLSKGLDDYVRKEREENEYAILRQKAGREKEVVIFIHGLGDDRHNWAAFPTLLAHEDIANPSLKKYFKSYVFRYDTVEDAKSVEGFKRELTGFINDIIKLENVPDVNIVGHSFGGVTTLKCLVHYFDDVMKKWGDISPEARAEHLIKGYVSGELRPPVKRFIGCGPSLSGSEMANIMADIFNKEQPVYQKNLPFFKSGVPIVGDVQVQENQIGSMINLLAFKRLDYERPLDPINLMEIIGAEDRKSVTDGEIRKLKSMGTNVLTVIGNPFSFMSPFTKPEDDGLVKCYSANLNHYYYKDSDGMFDIGYKGAQVRYVSQGHHAMIKVNDRNRPEYRYVVSFLNDSLIPQEDTDCSRVANFLVAVHAYPSFIDSEKHPEMCFRQEDKTYYAEREKHLVPKLTVGAQSEGGGMREENAAVTRMSTNPFTGVFFFEGHVKDPSKKARVVFKLQARGFKTKYVSLKVEGGMVTYAPHLTLEQQ